MKYIITILLATLLVSCGKSPEEITVEFNKWKPICDMQNKQTLVGELWGAYCGINYGENYQIEKCIGKYVDSIDEKYNNPDTVSNLKDSSFSDAVKTCNEVFGNKN